MKFRDTNLRIKQRDPKSWSRLWAIKEFLSTLVDKEDLPEVIAYLLKGGRKMSFCNFLSHNFHFTGLSLHRPCVTESGVDDE